jgi:hypothetical protein
MAAREALEFLFFFGVLTGYVVTSSDSRPRKQRRWRAWDCIVNALGAACGLLWIVITVANQAMLVALIFATIRGIENAQTLRRAGIVIYEPTYGPATDQQFLVGGIVAAILSLAICVALLRLALNGPQSSLRKHWVGLWTVCLLLDAALLAWGYFFGLPKLSPIWTPPIVGIPATNVALGSLLLMTIATLLAVRQSALRVPFGENKTSDLRGFLLLHERPFVGLLLVAGAVGKTYQSSDDISGLFSLQAPDWLARIEGLLAYQALDLGAIIRLAAVIAVGTSIFRSFRRPLRDRPVFEFHLARFATLALMWLATLLVVAPSLLWSGCVVFWL